MFETIKKMILGTSSNAPDDHAKNIQIATCALFVEMSQADGEFSKIEHDSIIKIMQTMFALSPEETKLIMETASTEVDESIDSWKFTSFLNNNLPKKDRVAIVEHIWDLVFADGHLDTHELYLTNKLGGLLKLSHDENIAAKEKALKKL